MQKMGRVVMKRVMRMKMKKVKKKMTKTIEISTRNPTLFSPKTFLLSTKSGILKNSATRFVDSRFQIMILSKTPPLSFIKLLLLLQANYAIQRGAGFSSA